MWDESKKSLQNIFKGQGTKTDIEPLQKYFYYQMSRRQIKGVNWEQKFGNWIFDAKTILFPKLKKKYKEISDDLLWEKFDNWSFNWVGKNGKKSDSEQVVAITKAPEEIDRNSVYSSVVEQAGSPFAVYRPAPEDAAVQNELLQQTRAWILSEIFHDPLSLLSGFVWDWLKAQPMDSKWRDLYDLLHAGLFRQFIEMFQGLTVPALSVIWQETWKAYVAQHPDMKASVIIQNLKGLYGFEPPKRQIQELCRKRDIEIKRQNEAQKENDVVMAAMPEKTRMKKRHQDMLAQLKPEEERLNRAVMIKGERISLNKLVKRARSPLPKKQQQTFKQPLVVPYSGDEDDD